MSIVVGLSAAYTAVVALLLNLGLATRWPVWLKVAAIAAATALYAVTYAGWSALRGWPTDADLPPAFRMHWVVIDEPDKATGAAGAVFFWARALDEAGRPVGDPRGYELPFEEQTESAAREALERLEGGERLNGYLSRNLMDPGSLDETRAVRREEAETDAGAETLSIMRFEFREVPEPELPPKPPPA